MSASSTMQAGLTWIDGDFHPGIRVTIGDDGNIASVQRGSSESPTHPRCALLPGFINAHSHSFQRGLRGRGELFLGELENFWTWREAMYELVEGLTVKQMHTLCVAAFKEMRRAGITTVGEFHYLHHLKGKDEFEGDRVVLRAAAEAGIRLVLLSAHYMRGGFEQQLNQIQLQFNTTDPRTYWEAFDELEKRCGPNQSMGVVAHSLRGVSFEDIHELHSEAKIRGLVFHMHLEEQRREISSCEANTGYTPTRLLLERIDPGPEFTAVHATHTEPDDLEEWLERGCHICLCPLTEANLGDGFPDQKRMLKHPDSIAIGTDSNARISMQEELRMLELGHRLHGEWRGAWRDAEGRVDRVLLSMATMGGASSLGINAGRIAEGALADLMLVNLDADTLQHVCDEDLGAALVLGSDREVVLSTCVGGSWQNHVE